MGSMWTYLLSLFLVAFAAPSYFVWLMPIAALCGYALFWRSIEGMRNRFFFSFLWFFCVGLIQFSWIATTTYNGPLMWLVYLFVAISQALLFGAVNQILRPIGVAGAWSLIEWARQYFLCGFPFSPIGLVLGAWPVGLQLASVIGSSGLTWIVLVTNAALFHRPRLSLSMGLAPYLLGGALLFREGAVKKSIDVALIEPKIAPPVDGNHPKEWRLPGSPYENWEIYLPLIEKLREAPPALIGFPEAAFTSLGDLDCIEFAWADQMLCYLFGADASQHYPDHGEWVSHAFILQVITNVLGSEVVAGMMMQVPGGVSNAAVHFCAGKPHHVYAKRRLLPVAESMSLSLFRWIAADFGIFDSFIEGKGPVVFQSEWGSIFPTVCYEETFSSASLEATKLDATLLFNVTNDGWYPRSRLEKEQKALAQLRSVESGLPSLRACNTGESGAFNCKGQPVPSLKQGDITFLRLPLSSRDMPYGIFKDLPFLLVSLASIAISLHKRPAPRKKVSLA